MFTTSIPFPALTLLRQAATAEGVPVTAYTLTSQLMVLNSLVDAGLAQATSSDGKAGYKATTTGLAELARLDVLQDGATLISATGPVMPVTAPPAAPTPPPTPTPAAVVTEGVNEADEAPGEEAPAAEQESDEPEEPTK
jgi:hypothetical protein